MFKIKFLDTGEELEVTRASQLFRTCFHSTRRGEVKIIEGLGFRRFDKRAKAGLNIFLWDDMDYTCCEDVDIEFRQFEFLPSQPTEPLPTPDNEPLPQSEGQRGEITPEALEAEGWEKKLTSDTGYKLYLKEGIIVWFYRGALEKIALWSHKMEGVSTMPDLRTLDRLVNGVAIPSTTNTNN